jgi:hypothetical protein
MLKLEFLSSFGSRVACELARASSLMKRAKIVARLVKKLTEQRRVETSYERVEPAHEFLVHSPAVVSVVRRLPQATTRGRGRMTARGEAHWRCFQAASFPHADRRRSSGWRPWRAAIGSCMLQVYVVWTSLGPLPRWVPGLSVFWTGNLLRGVPEVDERDSPRSVTRRKRHVAHNLDRFGPRGA